METNIDIIGHKSRILYLEKLLKKEQHSRTLLFTGIPGIGKSLTAKYLIKKEICEGSEPPCSSCRHCRQFSMNTYPDFIHLRPDAEGKIRIGDKSGDEEGSVRWLIRRLSETSRSGSYFVLIEDADKISEAGQNALLKTIEEPNYGTTIILTALSVNSILQTIRSRALNIRFSPLSATEIFSILKNMHPDHDESILEFASIASGGSMEYAKILLNAEKFKKISDLCTDIRDMIYTNSQPACSLAQLSKDIQPADLTNLLINIYQYNLETLIAKTPLNKHFDNLYIDEQLIILKLLKIMTALKKSEVYNINKDNALKAMIYGIHKQETDLPFLERLQI
ncbi:MAG: AAA family ATPase [Spirochaetes bacterium]|nr:AAA family ATPase [Spirochaetota bacterium]